MKHFSKHIISPESSIQQALQHLNDLSENLTLFVAGKNNVLLGTLTDGDIRRGLLSGLTLQDTVTKTMFSDFRSITKNNFSPKTLEELREDNIYLVPLLDEKGQILKIINLREKRTLLPLNAVLMAGGKGVRLKPLTDELPKPLLKVGDKPIIEHNIDRLNTFGIENIEISIGYLGGKIKDYLKDGDSKEMYITYIDENEPMGTIGAIKRSTLQHQSGILIMNADLLTNIDFEDLYKVFTEKKADMVVASIPYKLEIPYGVLELNEDKITGLREKPTYTYYSNAGIYLIKKELLDIIPADKAFDATDLMEKVISLNLKLLHYPILGYWLDIGKHDDYLKAQEDIKHIKL
jgi:dTDP-glucose pyrophosphorylase